MAKEQRQIATIKSMPGQIWQETDEQGLTDNDFDVIKGGSGKFYRDISGRTVHTSIADIRAMGSNGVPDANPNVQYLTKDFGCPGTWVVDEDDTTSADNTGLVLVTAGGKRLKRVHDNEIFVKWFGAKGDGQTDERSILNDIIQAIPDYSTLVFEKGKTYNISGYINLNKGIKIIGNGSRLNLTTEATRAIRIASSNIWIDGLKINGVKNDTYVANGYLIYSNGSSESNYYENIKITNCELHNNSTSAIRMWFIRNFIIDNNMIYNFPYGGVIIYSAKDGLVSNNNIKNIHGTGTPDGNAYGISISAQLITSADHRSEDVTISGNIINDVPTWEGIDTHGGKNLTITDNTVSNCSTLIALVGYPGSSPESAAVILSPENCVVTNNYLDRSDNDNGRSCITVSGYYDYGIWASAIISNNTTKGGEIRLQGTSNSIVSGNTCIRPNSCGVAIWKECESIFINNNIIIDANRGTIDNNGAVWVTGTLTKSYIAGNTLKRTDWVNPDGGVVNNYGFHSVGGNDDIVFGDNDFESAVTAQYDNVNNPTKITDVGDPNGKITAVVGSTYKRKDGGDSQTHYLKESGSGNTGWNRIKTISKQVSYEYPNTLSDPRDGILIKTNLVSSTYHFAVLNIRANTYNGSIPLNLNIQIYNANYGHFTNLGAISSMNIGDIKIFQLDGNVAVWFNVPTFSPNGHYQYYWATLYQGGEITDMIDSAMPSMGVEELNTITPLVLWNSGDFNISDYAKTEDLGQDMTAIKSVSDDYQMANEDYTILVDTVTKGDDINITLPASPADRQKARIVNFLQSGTGHQAILKDGATTLISLDFQKVVELQYLDGSWHSILKGNV